MTETAYLPLFDFGEIPFRKPATRSEWEAWDARATERIMAADTALIGYARHGEVYRLLFRPQQDGHLYVGVQHIHPTPVTANESPPPIFFSTEDAGRAWLNERNFS